jgi:hypothetical protein
MFGSRAPEAMCDLHHEKIGGAWEDEKRAISTRMTAYDRSLRGLG